MSLSSQPSTLNSPAAAPPALALEHLRAFAAWLHHGPGTLRQISGKADMAMVELGPRTHDLMAAGGLVVMGMSEKEGPIYIVTTGEMHLPSTADVVQRQLNTLSKADRVSIAAGIMASEGKRGKAARNRDRAQTELL